MYFLPQICPLKSSNKGFCRQWPKKSQKAIRKDLGLGEAGLENSAHPGARDGQPAWVTGLMSEPELVLWAPRDIGYENVSSKKGKKPLRQPV